VLSRELNIHSDGGRKEGGGQARTSEELGPDHSNVSDTQEAKYRMKMERKGGLREKKNFYTLKSRFCGEERGVTEPYNLPGRRKPRREIAVSGDRVNATALPSTSADLFCKMGGPCLEGARIGPKKGGMGNGD